MRAPKHGYDRIRRPLRGMDLADYSTGGVVLLLGLWTAAFAGCYYMIDQNKWGGSTTVLALAGATALVNI
jgi:hypothetical protein